MDAAVLDGHDTGGELDELSGGDFRFGVGTFSGKLALLGDGPTYKA